MRRRDFLKRGVVAGTAGVLLDACAPPGSEQIIPLLIPEEEFVPGVEEFLSTTCFECPAGCGLLARKIDGRIVKVEGNPSHPIARGGSCARGQALPQALYHPDRLQEPHVREGEHGGGRWRPISWDEAIERLRTELSALQQSGQTATLGFLTGALRGHRLDMTRRFLAVFGSTQHWIHEPFDAGAMRLAHQLTTGVDEPLVYDLERSNYVITFGGGLLEALRSPVRSGRALGHLRQGRTGRRGKFVAVESRMSLNAANADEWLAVRPGTEAIVALGVSHVLLRDELYDVAALAETEGFEAMRARVESDFGPEQVSEATGVSAERLERVARELAELGPAGVVGGDTATSGSAGLATALAVVHLNMLLGAYGREGGILFASSPPFAPWPALSEDPETEAPRVVEARSFARGLQDGSVGDARVLLVAGTNPVYSAPHALAVGEVLARVPFVASFASFLDETTSLADLVLPEPTPFERFDDDVPAFGVGVPMASLSGPVFSRPLYQGLLSMPDVLLRVAADLGSEVAAAFPWSSYEEALQAAWAGLHAVGRGSVVEARESRFWRRALEGGGWWDEDGAPAAEPMARGYRFELGPMADIRAAPAPASEVYPLTLEIYGSVAFGDGRSAHLPFLQELADPMTGVRWGSVVEINPDTAAGLGIAAGDPVEVASAHGQLRASAYLNPGLHPEAIAIAAGQGHTHYGRFAVGRGVNPFALAAPEVAPDLGEAALTVAVRVERA